MAQGIVQMDLPLHLCNVIFKFNNTRIVFKFQWSTVSGVLVISSQLPIEKRHLWLYELHSFWSKTIQIIPLHKLGPEEVPENGKKCLLIQNKFDAEKSTWHRYVRYKLQNGYDFWHSLGPLISR